MTSAHPDPGPPTARSRPPAGPPAAPSRRAAGKPTGALPAPGRRPARARHTFLAGLGLAALTACLPGAITPPPAGPGATAVPRTGARPPIAAPGTAAGVPVRATAHLYPAQILDFSSWKLTLPVTAAPGADHGDGPWANQVSLPALRTFSMPPYFAPTGDGTGVQFLAPVDGATTPGSHYPRSELREMAGPHVPAAWSSLVGTNTMTIREAITHLPGARPEVVAAQIHGPSSYVAMIRLDGNRLYVEHDGRDVGDLDTYYRLGTVFQIRMIAAGGFVSVSYNDHAPVGFPLRASGLYFKAGCYTQSNPRKGDQPGAYGAVSIYDLHVSH